MDTLDLDGLCFVHFYKNQFYFEQNFNLRKAMRKWTDDKKREIMKRKRGSAHVKGGSSYTESGE